MLVGAAELSPEPIALDDGSVSIASVGAKAARLADARRRGLPVLPGFVVPAGPGRSMVASLLPEVASRGPHAASLALMEKVAALVDLSSALRWAARLGPSLVARSSSCVEDDPVWSGAFSSYLDVGPGELAIAVAGCWASTLTPAVLALCERTGSAPPDVCPAVLVQPMVDPQASGTATYAPGPEGADSPVEIVAVWGPPAPLMAGWSEGWRATVAGEQVSGPAVGDAAAIRNRRPDRPMPPEWLRAVAELARRACAGDPAAIEWAVVDGSPVLLQARPAVVDRSGAGVVWPGVVWPGVVWPGDARPGDARPGVARPVVASGSEALGREVDDASVRVPGAVTVARYAIRYGGPLGDQLVLPWLLGMGSAASRAGEAPNMAAEHAEEQAADRATEHAELEPQARGGLAPPDALQAAVRDARALVVTAVGAEDAEADAAASQILERVAAGALEVLGELCPVDTGAAADVLSRLAEIGEILVASGALAHPEQLWSLSVEEVGELLARPVVGDWHRHRHRTLRWQALVQRVIDVYGEQFVGEGVAPGTAAGPARRLSAARDLRRVVPGDVVVLHRPTPQLAPALWVAAGLVAESGSGAAHLIEVARSLRVPAVVGVGSLAVGDEDLVHVDGDAGEITLLRHQGVVPAGFRGPRRAGAPTKGTAHR